MRDIKFDLIDANLRGLSPPQDWTTRAVDEITRLRDESKDKDIVIESLRTLVSELQGKLAGDTCNMCNYLERADCHEQKAGLRDEVEKYKEDDKKLRIMLAVSYSGPLLYSDDGELQDNRMLPCIDFVRDTPETISKKFTERLRAELLEAK